MIKIILTLILVILLFISGRFIPALKKFFGTLTSYLLKMLSFLGIRISRKEKSIDASDDFKNTYKDIKVVKLSNKNLKNESSIDLFALILLIIAGLLYLFNLKATTGNAISNWLYDLLQSLNLKFVKSAIDMNTLYTGVIFSVLSFAATKLMTKWKATKQNRIERKQAMIKIKAIQLMSSKELLDSAKKKDEQKYKELS